MEAEAAPFLQIALMFGGLAAAGGAIAAFAALSGAPVLGRAPESWETRVVTGAFLLAAHALTLVALWQTPKIGACLAAALGAGWAGAGLAGLVVLMHRPERPLLLIAACAARMGLGLMLLAPLWAYLHLIRMHQALIAGV